MEKQITLIQTDLVSKGLVPVEEHARLATYLMLCDIENARMGNNLDLTKTCSSMWLPISTLPTINAINIAQFIVTWDTETDKYKRLLRDTIRSNDDRLPDYIIINYDEGKYEGLTLNNPHSMYIRHIIREVFDKEI